MEVTSKGDLLLYLIFNIPMYAALAVLAWKLGPANLGMLDAGTTLGIYLVLAGLYLFQAVRILQISKQVFRGDAPEIDRISQRFLSFISAHRHATDFLKI